MSLRNPVHLLLAGAGVFMIAGVSGKFTKIIDLHVHDTMFVLSTGTVLIALAIFLFVCWAISLLMWRWMWSTWLTWIQIGVTLLSSGYLAFRILESGRAAAETTDQQGPEGMLHMRCYS